MLIIGSLNRQAEAIGDTQPDGQKPSSHYIQPVSYRAELTLDPAKNTFSGTITIKMDIKNPLQTIWLNQEKI
jgi:aminopeptidase N